MRQPPLHAFDILRDEVFADADSVLDFFRGNPEYLLAGAVHVGESSPQIHLKNRLGEKFGKIAEPCLALCQTVMEFFNGLEHMVDHRGQIGELVAAAAIQPPGEYGIPVDIMHLLAEVTDPKENEPVDHKEDNQTKEQPGPEDDEYILEGCRSSLLVNFPGFQDLKSQHASSVHIPDERISRDITTVKRNGDLLAAILPGREGREEFRGKGRVVNGNKMEVWLCQCGKVGHFVRPKVPPYDDDSRRRLGII